MAGKFDEVVAKAVYSRMRDEGSSYRFIEDILQIIFPDTGEVEILLFIGKCQYNSPR